MSTNNDSLRKDLEQIRDERATHANTAQRIGNALLGLLQVIEQKLDLSRFLRRDIDDKAEGHIRFLRGLSVGSGTHGMAQDGSAVLSKLTSMLYSTESQSGFGLVDRGDGKYRLDITDLMVWGKAIFNELEVRKLSYVVAISTSVVLVARLWLCKKSMTFNATSPGGSVSCSQTTAQRLRRTIGRLATKHAARLSTLNLVCTRANRTISTGAL